MVEEGPIYVIKTNILYRHGGIKEVVPTAPNLMLFGKKSTGIRNISMKNKISEEEFFNGTLEAAFDVQLLQL